MTIEKCARQNEQKALIPGDYPDPTILVDGDHYYMTHSSFNWAPGLLIWVSSDLQSWEPLGFALLEYDGDVWAPELIKHEDLFYIYYKTTGGNHVVTSASMEGPWSTPIDVGVGHIDPGHVVGIDGRRYLYLSKGHVVELSEDGLKGVGELRKVYDGWDIPKDWLIEVKALEGPKLFKRGDWYYMVSAMGGTAGPATSHMVLVARSKDPLGPWENDPQSPLIHTDSREEKWWSTGHGTLFEDLEGTWWCVYHGYEKGYHTLGRQTLLEQIDWSDDGWPRRKGSVHARELCSSLEENTIAHDDDFQSDELKPQWRFWGTNGRDHYHVGQGKLRLKAQGDAPCSTAPMALITGDHAYEIEVSMRLIEDAEGALMLYYNPSCFAGISYRANGETRILCHGQHPMHHVLHQFGEQVRLKLLNDRNEVQVYIKQRAHEAKDEWIRVGGFETSGYHHNTFGGFLSLRPCLASYGSGAVEFSDFKYRRI